MSILSLGNCGPSALLKTLVFIKKILDILMFIVPMGAIVIISIDLMKSVISSKEDDMKKNLNISIKRIIYAMFIFLVPSIVTTAMSLLGKNNVDFASCYNGLNLEKIAILEKEEEAEFEALNNFGNIKTPNFSRNAKLIINNSNISNGNNISGCDGVVFYENGIFYRPKSNKTKYNGQPKSKGSADYGYNKYFFELLKKMTSDAEKKGYAIYYSRTVYGAWRSYSKQEYFYNCYKTKSCNNGNLAAKPGTSNHGWGIASDLTYQGTKKHTKKEAINWAHKHASEYGLIFSVSSENWHIEPSVIKENDEKVKKCL